MSDPGKHSTVLQKAVHRIAELKAQLARYKEAVKLMRCNDWGVRYSQYDNLFWLDADNPSERLNRWIPEHGYPDPVDLILAAEAFRKGGGE